MNPNTTFLLDLRAENIIMKQNHQTCMRKSYTSGRLFVFWVRMVGLSIIFSGMKTSRIFALSFLCTVAVASLGTAAEHEAYAQPLYNNEDVELPAWVKEELADINLELRRKLSPADYMEILKGEYFLFSKLERARGSSSCCWLPVQISTPAIMKANAPRNRVIETMTTCNVWRHPCKTPAAV